MSVPDTMVGYLQSFLPLLQGSCCRLFCIASSRLIFGDTVSVGCPTAAGAAPDGAVPTEGEVAGGVALVCATAVEATAAMIEAAAIEDTKRIVCPPLISVLRGVDRQHPQEFQPDAEALSITSAFFCARSNFSRCT